MSLRLGTDTGGTFTDLVVLDERSGQLSFHKTPSTPGNPGQAVLNAVELASAATGTRTDAIRLLVHGTTVATNALLQRKGARVALVTTSGFRDVLQIQRQDRPRLYDLRARRTPPIVPRSLRFEIDERMRFDGSPKLGIDPEQVRQLAAELQRHRVEAIAVGLLHSYANPAHEVEVGRLLSSHLPGVTVCLSHDVVGQHGEYERFSTCAANAFVQPVMKSYLGNMESRLQAAGSSGRLLVMKSNGGVMGADVAAEKCIETVLSGPAGGVVAGAAMARRHTNSNLITADMGGTSFDVAVIHDGQLAFARDSELGGLALAIPMLDIHTVGAGGGSIAWADPGGSLRVGPHSAGAAPGPACYGRGGTRPTVTDANLVLGRLAASSLLGGDMQVDVEAARRAVYDHVAAPLGISVEAAAEGVIRVVNATMTAAIRKLTVQQGLDPREFTLNPFGGAGPLHAAELAAEMGIRETLVPVAPGVTSAIGLLMSNLREDRIRTHIAPLTERELQEVSRIADELTDAAASSLAVSNAPRLVQRAVGMRYRGQRHELVIDVPPGTLNKATLEEAFHNRHQNTFGYCRHEEAVEIASVWSRVEMELEAVSLPRLPVSESAPQPVASRSVVFNATSCETPVFQRETLAAEAMLVGPAVIEQLDATTLLWPGQSLRVDEYGQLVLQTDSNLSRHV